jgi:CRP-like cAMP-binding protein
MPASLFIKRVQQAVQLSSDDLTALRSLRVIERALSHREPLWRESDRPLQCAMLLSGFLCRRKIAGDRDQILAFSVPGDFPDLQTLHLGSIDHDLLSIGPSRVGLVTHEQLNDLLGRSKTLTHLFWRETLLDAAMFREWVCNVAAREALSRVAHLICEIEARLEVVGLAEDGKFILPFTQQDIANACGISAVHANRTLQTLRRRDLIAWDGRTVAVLDRGALRELGEFVSDYLHQSQPV